MSKIKKRIVEYYMFYCPGCKYEHVYMVEPNGSQWNFNGNMDNPSFTPSLLNRKFDQEGKVISTCHLFVTDGKIQYCGDSSHELSGQTIELSNGGS